MERDSFSWIVVVRHIVAATILASIHPILIEAFDGIHEIPIIISAVALVLSTASVVIVGMMVLFFTQRYKSKYKKLFVTSYWVMSILTILGQWGGLLNSILNEFAKYTPPKLPDPIQNFLLFAAGIFMAVIFLTITLGLDKEDHRIRNWRIIMCLIFLLPSFTLFYKIELPIPFSVICAVAVSALVAPLLAFFPLYFRRKGLSRFK